MSTTPVTPASAPVTAPPVTSTPTPAPTPTPTPTPTATPTAAPKAPQTMAERLSEGWKEAKAAVEKSETETPEVKETPAETATEETETPVEAAAEETPAAEETAEETAEPKPAETTPEEELSELEDETLTTPQKLAAELKKSPEAEKFFNDNPELKRSVFAALRRDNENREIRQLIPDIETAKVVTQAAATYQGIDNKFLGAVDKPGAQAFLDTWVKEAMIVDDQGNPKLDAQGRYQVHPALTNIFGHIVDSRLTRLEATAKQAGDTRLEAAIGIIREAISPSSPALDDVPEELKPYADSLKAQKEALDKQRDADSRQTRERQEVANTESIDRAEQKVATSVRDQLKAPFSRAGLTEWEQKNAAREIAERVDTKLESNALYNSIRESILAQPPSEERERRLTKHMLTYYQQYLGQVTAEVVRETKAGTIQRQTQRQETIDAQKKASKTDPVGASVTPAQPQKQTMTQMRESIISDYKKAHGGQEPSLEYVTAEAWKRMPKK